MSIKRVLFVCTGNLCRSPMAEAVAKVRWPDGVEFESAGVYALDGAPASEHAVAAAAELGGDLSGHGAQQVSPGLGESFDRVFVMTRRHLSQVVAIDPGSSSRADLLRPDGEDIADPYGLSLEDYRIARDEIVAALEERAAEWV